MPRDDQGETAAATIRMRMRRGWTDGARAEPERPLVQPRRRTFPQGFQCALAVVSDRVKCLILLEIEESAIARPSHHRPPDEAVYDLPTEHRYDRCGRQIRLQPGNRLPY